MINFDDFTNENKTEHNSNWPYIPDHPYRILIVGCSGSGKINASLNLINDQAVGLCHFNDAKAFIEYSNDMQDVYKNKVLIVFDDIIPNIINDKKTKLSSN